ncbi:MAG TPA: trehalose-phosphatase [Actinomycetota bacterium]
MRIDDVAEILGDPSEAGVILDVDGTLAPIVPHPELSAVPASTRRAIEALVGRYALVAVVSGRTTAEAAALVDVPGVAVAGLYGLDASPLPEHVVAEVEAVAEGAEGAWVERKGASVGVHLRQSPDPDAAEAALRPALERIAAAEGLEVLPGKRVLELVPAGRPRKGAAVERLVRDAGILRVLYAGDDHADLEAFAALDDLDRRGGRAVRVAVRGEETPATVLAAADLIVDGPEELSELLRSL